MSPNQLRRQNAPLWLCPCFNQPAILKIAGEEIAGSQMSSVTLYRIDPAKNMQRYYHMDIQRDLFGNQCLIREWGRIGRAGQMRIGLYRSIEEAEQALIKQREAKERKGYGA